MSMIALSVPAEWRGELPKSDDRLADDKLADDRLSADNLPGEAAPAVRARECPHCGVGALHPAAEANLGGGVLLLVCDYPACGQEVLMPMRRAEEKARPGLSAEQRERMKRLSF